MSTETDEGPADRPRWRGWLHYRLPGLWVALVFVVLSFTPSLLPRSGLFQGAICGVTGAIGYGFGIVGAWVWRAFADRDERAPSRRSWQVFAVVAAFVIVAAYVIGRHWQTDLRHLVGADDAPLAQDVLIPVVAALVFVFLVAIGRWLHALYRWLAKQLQRFVGPRAARGIGWAVVVLGTYYLVSGLLLQNLSDLANQTFSVRNGYDKPGVTQTTSSLRSGGPGSLVSWDSLGREGRSFTSTGPTAAQISAYTGTKAEEPIRAFAGLDSADSSEERAQLAVADLERAGGFDRKYLMIATTTGSGWVSPGGADSFEYMTGGDSAIVAMQYSFLPSWISYLVDQKKAREAGRDLFDAVYEHWLELPEAKRPKLIVFGESLGTFGGEAAFSGEIDMANRTSGALLTGPPNFNTLYREFVDNREKGSTEVEPVYKDGRIVRIDGKDDGVNAPVGRPWDRTRILYVQHPSDPIVWWSPNLILHEPDWLDEPRGTDVLSQSRWIPFVTFWQVTCDLTNATGVPGGHGHVYTPNYVDGWASVLQPQGWDQTKRDQLQAIIVGTDTE